MSHTKGPWELHNWPNMGGISIECPDYQIAWIEKYDDKPYYANARLIAAAPCLLEACKAARKYVEDVSTLEPNEDIFRMLDEAIQKAEGKS